MLSLRSALFTSILLCLHVSAMPQTQNWILSKIKELGSANGTAYNTTNPFFTGTSDIPVETVTLPLDHFGNNTGKLRLPCHGIPLFGTPIVPSSLTYIDRYIQQPILGGG